MRVLVLTHRLPYAPNRGDRLRAYHTLQGLRSRADVELVSLAHDDEEASHADDVRSFVPRVTVLRVPKLRNHLRAAVSILSDKPVTHSLLDAPGMRGVLEEIVARRRPDVVLAYCSGMARFAVEPPLDTIPMILDFVDIDSRKWRDMSQAGHPFLSWLYRRESSTLGAFEARAALHAFASLVVNNREAEIARALAPAADIHVVENGVELDRLRPAAPPADSTQVVFCGVMNYAPNDQGMMWFVQKVWPQIKAQRPDARLAIVGSDPTDGLRALCAVDPSIEVTGRVPDVREWLWKSAVSVAPLHVARGVQNKALEAIAAGLPIVITDAVAGGLPPVGAAASVANDPEPFAQKVLGYLAMTPSERRARAATANLAGLQWSSTLAPLWTLLDEAARGVRRPRSASASNPSSPGNDG